MSRPGITAEQVIAAAIRLLARGENPSVRNVRQELGNTGSNSTILAHLETWRVTLNERNLEVLPPGLPPALEEPLRLLWAVAVEAASEDYAVHKRELEAQTRVAREAREVAQAQIREALGEVQRLEGLLEERSRALETDRKELARERERNHALEEQLEAVRGEAARTLAEQRSESARILAEERADAQRDREVLEGRLAALEGQLARELERFDAQQRYWIDQVDAARRGTDQLRQAADNQIRLLTEELKQAQERQGKLERRLAAVDAEGQRLRSENRALREERDGLRERVERLSATLERRAGALMVLREHWRSTARTVKLIGADPQLAEDERVARLAQVLALPGMLDEAAGDSTR